MTWNEEAETRILNEFATRPGERCLSKDALKFVASSNLVRSMGNQSAHSASEAEIRVAVNSSSSDWVEVQPKIQKVQKALQPFQPFLKETFEFVFQNDLDD